MSQPNFEYAKSLVWTEAWESIQSQQREKKVFHFKWTMLFSPWKHDVISFIKEERKNFCCHLQLSNLPPMLFPCSKRKGHQVTDPKFQLVTQITDLLITMSSWPFAFPLQWRRRQFKSKMTLHGQFYKTLEGPVSPQPLPPHFPASPAGPACSLFLYRQELIIRTTFPTPDNDALLAEGTVCFEERVQQSQYLPKQL